MDASETYRNTFRFWLQAAFSFLLIASLFGLLMRLSWVVELPLISYKHMLHAHSHVAMMGWGFIVLVAAFRYLLLSHTNRPEVFQRVLVLNTFASVGMAISFAVQGYGAVSIAFSTAHLLIAYYFAYHTLGQISTHCSGLVKFFSKWAVIWMLVSTLGLWILAPVSALVGKSSPLYHASIQFFLHFQFNGWFTYGILALLVFFLERSGLKLKLSKPVRWGLHASLVLTYALSITWSTPKDFLFYINSLGVIIQLVIYLIICVKMGRSILKMQIKPSVVHILLWAGVMSLMLKILIQSAVVIPYIAEVSYTIRNFVIGFIHMTMLGSFTLTIISLLIFFGALSTGLTARWGYWLLMIGFLSTEFFLFGQGLALWAGWGFISYYYEIMVGSTLLLPIAISLIISSLLINKSFNPSESVLQHDTG